MADLGFAALVRAQYPGLALHASTQLNTHSLGAARGAGRLGFARAVLARELSLAEIAALQAHGLELEAFVHGALCYGYSGDCLLGQHGRRAQRQPRPLQPGLPHALRAAGGPAVLPPHASRPRASRPTKADLGRRPSAPPTWRPSACCPAHRRGRRPRFKIEGRMKDAAYVAVTTAVYREALDAAAGRPRGLRRAAALAARLEQSFSRGFTTAHLEGRHHEVRSGGRGGHRGVRWAVCAQMDESRAGSSVRLSQPLAAGDRVYLFTPVGPVRGGARGRAATPPPRWRRCAVRERVAVKDRLFRLSAAAADAFTEDAVAGRVVARPLLLEAELRAAAGEVPRLRVRAGQLEVDVRGDEPLAVAERARLNPGRARDAVGALGGTPYRLAGFHAALEGDPFLPVGALKELRRRALAELDARRLAVLRRPAARASFDEQDAGRIPLWPAGEAPLPVVLRILSHETPLTAPAVTAVALDIEVSDDPAAIAAALEQLTASGFAVRCRPPEVLFDADLGWWSAVAALPWTAVYTRHLVHLTGAPQAARILEYPLQGLNAETARLLRPRAVVAGPEASLGELADLAARLAAAGPAIAVEALVFGRQQLLLTRDVLGRAEGLVAEGERAALELADTKDFVFPAEAAPQGTRIFNSRVTNLAAAQADLAAAGVSAAVVVQRDLSAEEREAMAAGGLAALAAFAGRGRSTTGHLFRGVA